MHLLDVVPLTSDDHLIHIGDLLDRGPNPAQVVEFFQHTPNATSLLGNRDDKHLQVADGQLKNSGVRKVTRHQFGDDDRYHAAIDYIRTLPTYIDHPDANLVHGYYEPSVPVQDQRADVLVGHRSGHEHLLRIGADPFYVYYDQPKPLVIGHRPYPFLHYQRKVYMIDTRAVYGGTLTGLLLPDFTLYSVPARADHWLNTRRQYADMLA